MSDQTSHFGVVDWSESPTSSTELWKNQRYYSLEDNLRFADGAVHFHRQVIENLREQIAQLNAELFELRRQRNS